ncbi:MAG: hypothetical protein ACT4PJ_17555 [Gemmatimonadaceae bacterium]
MAPYRDTLDASSTYYEACARHKARQTARGLQVMYTCDPCTVRLVREVFNDRPPVYHGETVDGYCGLCNQRRPVTLRQYFSCVPCWSVVVAYQKGFVASRAVHEWWARDLAPSYRDLSLIETEPVLLLPYVRGAKTKRQAAATKDVLDFKATERGTTLFHIELKSGPGSIDGMSEFQLDVNDYNDIVGAVKLTRLPAYIVHVQLAFDYLPPTRGTVVKGMWWTDLATFMTGPYRVKKRHGEEKKARYCDAGCFQPMTTFASEIAERRYEELGKRLGASPIDML